MVLLDAREVPVDPLSHERLSRSGLEYRVVDASDRVSGRAFARADARGFLEEEPSDEAVGEMRGMIAERRNVGVFAPAADGTAAPDALPIGTVNSWVTPLTVPGGAAVPLWAISGVTVAGTHRRRGIARSLLEGELRAAAEAGVPVAGLTVSEATIYGRYGFGAAIPVARVEVDARRAGGIAPEPSGSLEYVEGAALQAALEEAHEQGRPGRAGDIAGWPLRWRRMAGLAAGDDKARAVRGVRSLDGDGAVRGALAYTLDPHPGGFGADLAVRHLTATTSEALRALWGFALNHDLIRTVRADLRPVDDPLPWLVADQRAVEFTVHDHGWLRILDVPAALSARTYRAPLDIVIRVADSLDIAAGAWRLRIDDDGTASIEPSDDAADVELDVAALSSLYLGGVSAPTLHAAGRIRTTAEIARRIADAFGSAEAPVLTIWY